MLRVSIAVIYAYGRKAGKDGSQEKVSTIQYVLSLQIITL